MKNTLHKKLIVGSVLAIFILINSTASLTLALPISSHHTSSKTIEVNLVFTSPIIQEKGDCIQVTVDEANTVMTEEGKPWMPLSSYIFEFVVNY